MIGDLLTRCKVFFYYQLAVSPRELRGGMVLLCLVVCIGVMRVTVDFSGRNPEVHVPVKQSELLPTGPMLVASPNRFGRCPEPMDVNMADTLLLKRLHGIGKVLSRRIVRYRELLGGFVSPEQVGEVYGVSDSTLRHILPRLYVDDTYVPLKLDLETATYSQMYDHPYITSREATAILRYREQHYGKVRLDQLLSFTSERRKKILPYVLESMYSD